MGLLDIINDIGRSAPSGQPQQQPGQRQGMSPMAMAMLALLAYKALSRPGGIFGNAGQTAGSGAAPAGSGAGGGGLGDILGRLGGAQAGAGGGGLGGLLQGGLGGLLGGAAAGTVVSGGLNDLLKQFQDAGHGDVAKSWVGTGDNKEIDPGDLASALGADKINALSQQTGMSRDDLLEGLARQLPRFIDQLTPDGRVPTEQEASRLI